MKIISLFLWWPIIGIVVIYAVVFIHLIIACMKGYDPTKYWENYSNSVNFSDSSFVMRFIIGMYIWPYRLIEFLANIPDLYTQYDLQDDKEEP